MSNQKLGDLVLTVKSIDLSKVMDEFNLSAYTEIGELRYQDSPNWEEIDKFEMKISKRRNILERELLLLEKSRREMVSSLEKMQIALSPFGA